MKQFPINAVCISSIHEDGRIMAETCSTDLMKAVVLTDLFMQILNSTTRNRMRPFKLAYSYHFAIVGSVVNTPASY
jgi:hypothetical protein